MNLEERYLVIKYSDFENTAFTEHQKDVLVSICQAILEYREKNGKEPMECLVLEKDWPEFKPAIASLAERVHGVQRKQGYVAMFDDNYGIFRRTPGSDQHKWEKVIYEL